MNTRNTLQTGVTLIELMIAMVIGLIVSGAVATIFIQSKASYTQNDEINYIQDNGRYALNILAQDLEAADFWGGMTSPDTIVSNDSAGDGDADDYLLDTTECGSGTNWTYNATDALSYFTSPSSSEMAATFPCISSFQTGTDVLMIKRVKGDSTTSPSTEKIYVYTNRSNGEFNTGHHTLDTANGEQAWEYYVHLYYLEDGILKKKYLTWDDSNNKFIMDTTELAEGIEKFHVMFGIDSDDDGAMDYYTSSPSNADLDGVISARIYVLAKSSKEVNGYTNSKTYSLGDITISGGNDGYYRRVFSTSVILRNPLIINTIANS